MTQTDKMTAAELRHIGQNVYGNHWRSKLADLLTRDVRTVRRWGTGESPVPAKVAERLRKLAARHGVEPFEPEPVSQPT